MYMLNEVDKPEVTKSIMVYAGRFQPFHKGHYAVYKHLVQKFGVDNVYIASSNDTSGPKSPLTFKQKKQIATQIFDVPSSKFVLVTNPYKPVEILKKYKGKTTQYITAVGQKDADRLQGNYFKPYKGKAGYGYDEIGYVYVVPMQKGGISATEIRKGLTKPKEKDAIAFFKKHYPKYDADIFQMIRKKLLGMNLKEDGLPGGAFVGLTSPAGYINGAPDREDVEKLSKKLGHKSGERIDGYEDIKELVKKIVTEDDFNAFISEYLKKLKKDHTEEDIITKSRAEQINKFIDWATERLELSERPKVNLVTHRTYESGFSLAEYIPSTRLIQVVVTKRLVADILRSLAHEMVHYKQHEMGMIKDWEAAGKTGSPIENQANTIAGIMLRDYGKVNKEIYVESKSYLKEAIIDDELDAGLKAVKQKVEKHYPSVVRIQYDLESKKYTFVFLNKDDAQAFRHQFKGTLGQEAQFDAAWDNENNWYDRIPVPFPFQGEKQSYWAVRFKTAVRTPLFETYYLDYTDPLYIAEVTGLSGYPSSGKPDGMYLPKGAKRKLGGDDGKQQSEPWYKNGGYIQQDFPKGDQIWGDKDAQQITVKYSFDNVPRTPKKAITKFTIKKDAQGLAKRGDAIPKKLLGIPKLKKNSLLKEGGAYGHMSHPFEDMGLTFGDLKDIVKKALNGDLGVVKEKLDGQALAISWKNGRLIAARNKSHLENAGANAMGIEDVASKFGGRGGLTDAFNFAMKDLNAAIAGLSKAQRDKIFKEGQCFMNLEVIYPESVNVIPYGQALLVFHGTVCYDKTGKAVGADSSSAKILAGMIKQINADVQSKYTIQGPPITELPKKQSLKGKQSLYVGKLGKLQNEFKLKDGDTLSMYHYKWWENFIDKNAPAKIDKITKAALVRRFAYDDKSFRISSITNKEVRDWAMETSKVDVVKKQKENMRKFEEIFLGVGADVLEFVSSAVTVNPDMALRQMKDELDTTAAQIDKSTDAKKIEKFKMELERLKGLGGAERIVPIEGIVFNYKGGTYKLTGTFAPLNQLLGIFY